MYKEKEHKITVPDVEKVGVYAIYNQKTGRYYVGSSVNIKKRMKEHRKNIENLSGSNLKMQSDLKSDADIKNFSFIVLEVFEDYSITENDLRKKEDFYINKLDAYNGYNDENHRPYTCGYFGKYELLFCRKQKARNKYKINAEQMTNRQLLNAYKREILRRESCKTITLAMVESQILKRMDKQ